MIGDIVRETSEHRPAPTSDWDGDTRASILKALLSKNEQAVLPRFARLRLLLRITVALSTWQVAAMTAQDAITVLRGSHSISDRTNAHSYPEGPRWVSTPSVAPAAPIPERRLDGTLWSEPPQIYGGRYVGTYHHALVRRSLPALSTHPEARPRFRN
jgi:hypothetical protein